MEREAIPTDGMVVLLMDVSAEAVTVEEPVNRIPAAEVSIARNIFSMFVYIFIVDRG